MPKRSLLELSPETERHLTVLKENSGTLEETRDCLENAENSVKYHIEYCIQ